MIRIVQVFDVVIIFGKDIPGLKKIIQAQSVKISSIALQVFMSMKSDEGA